MIYIIIGIIIGFILFVKPNKKKGKDKENVDVEIVNQVDDKKSRFKMKKTTKKILERIFVYPIAMLLVVVYGAKIFYELFMSEELHEISQTSPFTNIMTGVLFLISGWYLMHEISVIIENRKKQKTDKAENIE